MLTQLCNKRGFNSVDCAVTIGLVGLMAVGMAPLVKRGAQARIKAAVDNLGAGQQGTDIDLKKLEQYEPYYAETKDIVTSRNDDYTESYDKGTYKKTGVVSGATRKTGGEQLEHGSAQLGADDNWK